MAAEIKWLESTDRSIKVCLDGLSGSNHTANDRTAYWYLDRDETGEVSELFGTQELAGGITSTEDMPFTFSGLSMPSGTIHYIRCVILNTSGTINKTLKIQLKTGNMIMDKPVILYGLANQYKSDPPIALYKFGVEHNLINELTRYSITVRPSGGDEYEIRSGFILDNVEDKFTIEMSSLGTYYITLRVFNGIYVAEYIAGVTLRAKSNWESQFQGLMTSETPEEGNPFVKIYPEGIVWYFRIQSKYNGLLKINRIAGYEVSNVQIFLSDDDESYIIFGNESQDRFLVSGSNSVEYEVKKNKLYHCWVRPTTYGDVGEAAILFTFPTKDKVFIWDWTASNNNASMTQTVSAHTALTSDNVAERKLCYFNYMVWNDMVDKVVEIQEVVGEAWDSTYATSENTKMRSSDKVLTAARFNSLRKNIDLGSVTGIDVVSRGDIVKADYFTTLTTHINNWINSISE